MITYITKPFKYFFKLEAASGLVLLFAAILALIISNGSFGEIYFSTLEQYIILGTKEFGLKLPGEILDKTRELVIEQFAKSEEDVKDGMDVALCVLDTKSKKLSYAGANNPLWVIEEESPLITTRSPHIGCIAGVSVNGQ